MFVTDYELLQEIDRGRFGVVSKIKSRKTGEIFAVKSIDKSSVCGDSTDKLALINEPKALNLLSHSPTSSPSCQAPRLHSVYESPTHLHLILDYVPFPSLFDFVSLRHRLPEPESRPIIASLLHAVLHCHLSGVVHRDIKPENILFDPDTGKLKVCDFGSSGFINEGELNEVVGTPYYMAPEVIGRKEYDEKVDVWSVGVVLYALLAGFPPFNGDTGEEIYHKVLRANLRFPSSVDFSSSVKDLLRRMICKDVSRRFSVQQALRHSWFMANEGQSTTVT